MKQQNSLRHKCIKLSALCFLVLFSVLPAFAVQPDEILPNPQLEARARAISTQLRCLVCRNENIDESSAPLAHDLRLLVRARLAAGDTDAQVLQFMVARYGQYVLLKPPFFSAAMLLWVFPLLLLFCAALYLLYAWHRLNRQIGGKGKLQALTPEEKAHLNAFLAEEADKNNLSR